MFEYFLGFGLIYFRNQMKSSPQRIGIIGGNYLGDIIPFLAHNQVT